MYPTNVILSYKCRDFLNIYIHIRKKMKLLSTGATIIPARYHRVTIEKPRPRNYLAFLNLLAMDDPDPYRPWSVLLVTI